MKTIDDKIVAYTEQLAAINEIQDFEEQGYASAPIIRDIAGCSIEGLLQATLCNPETTTVGNALRDIGVRRWCHEQMKAREQDPDYGATEK